MKIWLRGICLLGIFLCFECTFAQKFDWAHQFSGEGEDAGMAIAEGPSGDIYMCGYFGGMAEFQGNQITGFGLSDAFLARFSPDGTLVWVSHAGSGQADRAYGITVNQNEEIYIVGHFEASMQLDQHTLNATGKSDIFLAKYDRFGKVLWARSAGGSSFDRGNDVALDKVGNVYITGYITGLTNFDDVEVEGNASFPDIAVAKYTPNGTCLWARSFGGPWEDMGLGMDVNDAGEVYVTGFFYDFLLVDECYITSEGSSDIFLTKLSTNGQCMWSVNGGSFTADEGRNVKEDGKGSVYVTGYHSNPGAFGPFPLGHSGYDDIFLAKYNANGVAQWVRQGGGADLDFATGLDVDEEGNIYVSGAFDSQAQFGTTQLTGQGNEIFILKYDATGELVWSKSAGDANGDFGSDVLKSGTGKVYVCGWYYFISVFDAIELGISNNADIFLAKLDDEKVGVKPDVNTPKLLIQYYEQDRRIFLKFQEPIEQYQVIDVSGKVLVDKDLSTLPRELAIDVRDFSAGVYVLKIELQSGTLSRKILVY